MTAARAVGAEALGTAAAEATLDQRLHLVLGHARLDGPHGIDEGLGGEVDGRPHALDLVGILDQAELRDGGRIAAILGIDLARVSVKATTTAMLGFTGRGEGLAAQAMASVRLPD